MSKLIFMTLVFSVSSFGETLGEKINILRHSEAGKRSHLIAWSGQRGWLALEEVQQQISVIASEIVKAPVPKYVAVFNNVYARGMNGGQIQQFDLVHIVAEKDGAVALDNGSVFPKNLMDPVQNVSAGQFIFHAGIKKTFLAESVSNRYLVLGSAQQVEIVEKFANWHRPHFLVPNHNSVGEKIVVRKNGAWLVTTVRGIYTPQINSNTSGSGYHEIKSWTIEADNWNLEVESEIPLAPQIKYGFFTLDKGEKIESHNVVRREGKLKWVKDKVVESYGHGRVVVLESGVVTSTDNVKKYKDTKELRDQITSEILEDSLILLADGLTFIPRVCGKILNSIRGKLK